ncbi:MAG: M48 family peptidase [Dehalococcoidia bacterium]|nr:M48 family peptidase [Dehalococcoidia bacterium]
MGQYARLPGLLFSAVTLLAVLLGLAFFLTVGPQTRDVIREHRATLVTDDGLSRMPPASLIDLQNDPWVHAAKTRFAVRYVNLLFTVLATAGVLLALVLSGYSARLRTLCEQLTRPRTVRLLLFLLTMTVLIQLLLLPLAFLSSFYLPFLFGTSTITGGLWLQDFALDLAVTLLLQLPVFLVLYWLMARFTRTWWAWMTALAVPFFIVVVYLWPLAVEPLFNSYTLVDDPAIRGRIERLAERAGVSVEDVSRVDLSRRTLAGNAYVSGLGPSKRIAIGDTLLEHYTPDEVAFVVAHELGHSAEAHLWWAVGGQAAVAFAVFLGTWLLLRWYAGRPGPRHGITRSSDVATYPLIVLVLFLSPIVLGPAFNSASRYLEHRADAYALRLTGDPEAGIASFKKLAYQGLSVADPPEVLKVWFSTHPSIKERIGFLQEALAEQKPR